MEKEIGRVTHYFSRLDVAAVDLTDGISVGDKGHISGHTSDFTQTAESVQVAHHAVERAVPGDDVAIQVRDHVREHDRILKET